MVCIDLRLLWLLMLETMILALLEGLYMATALHYCLIKPGSGWRNSDRFLDAWWLPVEDDSPLDTVAASPPTGGLLAEVFRCLTEDGGRRLRLVLLVEISLRGPPAPGLWEELGRRDFRSRDSSLSSACEWLELKCEGLRVTEQAGGGGGGGGRAAVLQEGEHWYS